MTTQRTIVAQVRIGCRANAIGPYCQRIKASIHVTVLHRHAIKDVDVVDITLEEQVISQNTFLLFSQTQNMTATQSIR